MKALLLVLVTIALLGCAKDGEAVDAQTAVGGADFSVVYLFEVDGVRVYRFSDGGRYHYFTTDGTSITDASYTTTVGKTTVVHHEDDSIRRYRRGVKK